MDNEENIGFVPVKPAATVCSNLFFSGSLNDGQSPMSELAKSLQLSQVKIARRRLSLLSDGGIPTPDRSLTLSDDFSFETGINSPLSECPDVDSPTIEYIRSRKTKDKDMRRKCSSRSFSSPILIRKPLTPLTLFHNNIPSPSPFKPVITEYLSSPFKPVIAEYCSSSPFKPVNLEYREENHSDLSISEMADNVPDISEDFRIKRRSFGARPRSAPTVNMSFDNEPIRGEACDDDRFFGGDLLKSGENNMSPSCPSTFFGLVEAPMVHITDNTTEYTEDDKENFIFCKGDSPTTHIFQKPIGLPFKKRSISCSTKRMVESPTKIYSTKKQKTKCGRSQSFFEGDTALLPIQPMRQLKEHNAPRPLMRSQSFDLHNVKSGNIDVTDVDMDDRTLTGDKSTNYLLPLTESKHPDLKGISCETLAELMYDAYKDDVDEHIIVDCRYPYEYDGGHIRGAVNIHDKQGMIDFFLKNPLQASTKRRIIVFHCEFSSKRGPAMCRFLRNKDRDIHMYCYPTLYYPEMYLLEGGYKEFYETQKKNCSPPGYREMLDGKFHNELRLFSRRSKSWSEDNSLRSKTTLRY